MYFGTPRNFVFQDFEASGLPESLFFKISRLRDSPKACFQDFEASGHPESLLFKISRLRGILAAHFSRKQLVGAPRNIVFPNFSLSDLST